MSRRGEGGGEPPADGPSAGTKSAVRYSVPALEKGFEVLELLARTGSPLTLTGISASLQRSTGEIYRTLQFLEARDYIERDRGTDSYALSMKLFQLSHEQPPVRSLSAAAIPLMEALAAQAGQSCHLAVLNRLTVTIVATITSPLPITYGVRLGAQFPAWETSSGILLCAFLAGSARRSLLANLAQVVDDQALAELEGKTDEVRRAGFEQRSSLRVPGIVNISFPVFDRMGACAAALTVPYLPQRSSPASIEQVRALTDRAAADLSHALGFSAPSRSAREDDTMERSD